MKNFWKGVVTGAGAVLALWLVLAVAVFFRERDRRMYEYLEAEYETQGLREDIGNRPPGDFLEDPGIRGAADSAAAEFQRKRDEAVRAIRRSRIAK